MENKKIVKAIDVEFDRVESSGTAYYRITSDLRDFLKKCNEKHGILGFEFEEGSLNFGVILNKSPEEIISKEENLSAEESRMERSDEVSRENAEAIN